MIRNHFRGLSLSPDPKVTWEEKVAARPLSAVLFDLDGTLIETDDQIIERFVSLSSFLEARSHGRGETNA